MMKIEGSGSASGTGSIGQTHGSADPGPHQNVMDPQHWYEDNFSFLPKKCQPKRTELVFWIEFRKNMIIRKFKQKILRHYPSSVADSLLNSTIPPKIARLQYEQKNLTYISFCIVGLV